MFLFFLNLEGMSQMLRGKQVHQRKPNRGINDEMLHAPEDISTWREELINTKEPLEVRPQHFK